MTEREQLMKELCEQQFAAYEVGMFLDTHPDNKQALEAMRKFSESYKVLKCKYEEKFGMLDIFSPVKGDTWQWVNDPWPWD